MWPIFLLILYCALIVMASLAGGWLPSVLRLSHTSMQLIMSLVGGLMMGVALLHLLPHAIVESGSLDTAALTALLGLLAMFFLIRIFHVHQHGPHEADVPLGDHQASLHVTDHSHTCSDSEGHRHGGLHRLSWLGLFVGLSLHTLIDGVALAASVAAAAHDDRYTGLYGLGTFLAVVLHKPLDALSITSVMVNAGWSRRWTGLVNAGFALMSPLGALAFYFGIQELAEAQHAVVGGALGFAAGVFLCIALADILPEVQFHSHDRIKLSAALLAGVLLAYGIGYVEPEHAHLHEPAAPTGNHQHAHPP